VSSAYRFGEPLGGDPGRTSAPEADSTRCSASNFTARAMIPLDLAQPIEGVVLEEGVDAIHHAAPDPSERFRKRQSTEDSQLPAASIVRPIVNGAE